MDSSSTRVSPRSRVVEEALMAQQPDDEVPAAKGETSAPVIAGNGSDPSVRLFRHLRGKGVTEKRIQADPRLQGMAAAAPGVPTFDDEPQQGPGRLYAGKKTEGNSFAPPLGKLSARRPLTEAGKSASGVNPGWHASLRMMDDIGWDIVMDKVTVFVDSLTLTEVAEEFKDPMEDLISEVVAFWKDNDIREDVILGGRMKTTREAASAFCAYVWSFQKKAK